ncbi:Hpt domain-containing protein [Janthinobacterium sp. SUN026]|uniref:Hpt domain-containing protein n=1 Tax=unclassified Janthinobacterium TaxID=2610881 RepID=UPI0025B362F5|nr:MULTISPECIES: Hpt domain-containing protein [unclassified Janthinobacterium]MDN2672148.1 Hpt domain-containing protein [Janthinobacterium sp. SUN026]MDN2700541.1 Hpt domain-containing protein [Janthinobacterium sp. SUN100]
MPAYRHIDPAVLFQATGRDLEMFRALSQTYLDTAPAMFARVEQAVRGGAAQAIVHSCHTLRGTVVLLGASALAARLAEFEQLVRHQGVPATGWLAETAALVGAVEQEVRRSMLDYTGAQA